MKADRQDAAPATRSCFVTDLTWFGLVQHYSANRLAALTFLAPLFGVAAGHLVFSTNR